MEAAKIQEEQVRRAIDFICTSEHYHTRWEEIARQLGYTEDDIKRVKEKESDLNKQCFYFFKYVWWENMGLKATIGEVCDALDKCGMIRAREKLEEHCAVADPRKVEPFRELPGDVLGRLDEKDLNLAVFILCDRNPRISNMWSSLRRSLTGIGNISNKQMENEYYLSMLSKESGIPQDDGYFLFLYFLFAHWRENRKANIGTFLRALTMRHFQRTRDAIEDALHKYHLTEVYPDIPDLHQNLKDHIKKIQAGEIERDQKLKEKIPTDKIEGQGNSSPLNLPIPGPISQFKKLVLEESCIYAPLSDQTLLNLAKQIGNETELMDIAIGLGVTTEKVNSIKYEYKQDINMTVFNVLLKWKKSHTGSDVDKMSELERVLVEMKRNDIVKEIIYTTVPYCKDVIECCDI